MCLVLACQCTATSFVILYGHGRIIFAADERGTQKQGTGNEAEKFEGYPTICKLAVLGRSAFAASSVTSYLGDRTIHAWTAADDARTAYRTYPNDLLNIANEWERLEHSHFATLSMANPRRFAQVGPIIVLGAFAGFDGSNHPVVILRTLNYSQMFADRIQE